MLAPRTTFVGGVAVVMVRKGKPVSTARHDKIIEEIVDTLRPWKSRKSQAALTADLKHELDVLLKLVPLESKLADRKQNREHAQKLDRALSEVEALSKSAPSMLAWLLFDPLPPVTFTDDSRYPLAQPILHKSIEEIESAYLARFNSFNAELRRLRKVCARAIKPGIGSHPNYDHAKHTCASFAHGLMHELSDRKITGTKDDAFRAIASLLYEAVSGQGGADLKRACDNVLNHKL